MKRNRGASGRLALVLFALTCTILLVLAASCQGEKSETVAERDAATTADGTADGVVGGETSYPEEETAPPATGGATGGGTATHQGGGSSGGGSGGSSTGSGSGSAGAGSGSGSSGESAIVYTMVTVPDDKKLNVTLNEGLSTETTSVGENFTATVSKDMHVQEGNIMVIPAGSIISGEVVEVQSAKRFSGQAKLVLKFDRLRLPSGKEVDIVASLGAQGPDTRKRTAGGVAGGAAAGAILGKIIGKDTKDAVVGAVIGGAIGTGVVASMDNKDVVLPAGTALVLHIDQAFDVPVPKSA